ncbi:MAG: type II toxin-antitoxin system Phd/YefM family antitoxin [Burkholderiaceae bacterium]|jgi:antitoxin YefM|nr:type II toxin-antitoxin system Phd/YefM family antitoxin [Burkholderiaceae bacterium]MDP4919476.1 type II toxin-antitoxin system Phd/YefM family antitoxin [Burkholderiaceae bacterium]MDP5127608.1 type II toxin-antitoxin system Phd/YefM family antitoxin [Burkholderiaceae bacterium]HCO58264.1 type II toxin-antitoxin system prevent-host-death family antitoxin [Burkholderiales bacterium]
MDTVKATEARAKLYGLIDQVEQSHEPVLITGKRSNAVLIAEDDWKSVQETLYLLSLPGMRESLIQGVSTPTSKLKKSLPW